MIKPSLKLKPYLTITRMLPLVLFIGGLLGVIASIVLTLDTIELAKDPNFHPACNLNPVFSCASVTDAWQAETLGIPNAPLGAVGYAIIMTVGAVVLAGGQMNKRFWQLLNLGALAAFVFMHWLISQSLYSIGALCLYCMLTWAVTAPIFWYTTLYNIRQGHLPFMERWQKYIDPLLSYHGIILASWYAVIITLIFLRFREFFSTLV